MLLLKLPHHLLSHLHLIHVIRSGVSQCLTKSLQLYSSHCVCLSTRLTVLLNVLLGFLLCSYHCTRLTMLTGCATRAAHLLVLASLL